MASAFIRRRPRYFGEIMANLLSRLGPERILFGSDSAIWSPKWIIFGENAARLYGIDIAAHKQKPSFNPF